MSDFRTRLLGLVVLGASMAGVSYGQVAPPCSGVQLAGITAVLRAEGQTELVQDVTGTDCVLPAGVTNGSFTLTVPNATLETTNPLLSITSDTEDAGTIYYSGTVVGTTITFTNLIFPAEFNFRVYNIRVNAATAPLNSYVTENGTIEYTTPQSVTGEAVLGVYAGLQVGYTQTSLSASLSSGVTNYFTCIGNSAASYLPSASFTLNINEITPGAFKQLYAAVGSGSEGENGSSPAPSVTVAGGGIVSPYANTPTELLVTISNVQAGAVVYLPFTVSAGTAPNNTTLQLLGYTSASSTPASIASSNVVGFIANSAGVITATYQVTAAPITGSLTFAVPIEVTFAANTLLAQSTAITVSVAYAPAVATLTGPPTTIPTFAIVPVTVFNGSTIGTCQTDLLFPFVTNLTGYETGLAIANTTTDNLGAKGAAYSSPTPGTCTLNFYGNVATQPTAVTTTSIGAYNATTPQAPVWDATLTSLITISDFTGYAIAQCDFLDAHGFAFIVDTTGSGTASGPEGYLAVVLPRLTTTGHGADAGSTGQGDGN